MLKYVYYLWITCLPLIRVRFDIVDSFNPHALYVALYKQQSPGMYLVHV